MSASNPTRRAREVGFKAAAEHLAVDVSTLRGWVRQGHVPCSRAPSRRIRFDLDELDRWREKRAAIALEMRVLAIPRPRTLAECAQEARPCPWVSCRHHLLLEVASPKVQERKDPRPTTLRLNMPRRDRIRHGRRPGLASSAAAAIVQTWIDDAVELLSRMRYTCTFDVIRDYPDGLTARGLAVVLGVTEQGSDKAQRTALRSYVQRAAGDRADEIAHSRGLDDASQLAQLEVA